MRICMVLDDTLDSTDGVQQYVICVGEWLRARGHDVHYLVGETKRQDLPNIYSLSRNRRVKFNGNSLSVPLPASKASLKATLDNLHPDVLHIQTPYSPFMAGRLIEAASDSTAVVGTFHILPYSALARFANGILGKVNTRTGTRFDAMMAVSPPAQHFAGKLYGFTSAIVSNPFIHDRFSVARRGKKSINDVKRIIFLGRLVERKGAFELLKAIAALSEHQLTEVRYEVVIAGRGRDDRKLKDYARTHGLDDTVTFPGFVEESAKAALLASADIAVFPSISGESFGISLLEAMAASRGVVLAGNNLGYASVVASQEQLIDPRDTQSFAETLAHWLADDAGRTQAARLQQEHVRQFDIDVIGPKIEALYERALQKRAGV